MSSTISGKVPADKQTSDSRNNDELASIIRSVRTRCGVNIADIDKHYSPSRGDQYAGHDISAAIRHLYFRNREDLKTILHDVFNTADQTSSLEQVLLQRLNHARIKTKAADKKRSLCNEADMNSRLRAVATATRSGGITSDRKMSTEEVSPFNQNHSGRQKLSSSVHPREEPILTIPSAALHGSNTAYGSFLSRDREGRDHKPTATSSSVSRTQTVTSRQVPRSQHQGQVVDTFRVAKFNLTGPVIEASGKTERLSATTSATTSFASDSTIPKHAGSGTSTTNTSFECCCVARSDLDGPLRSSSSYGELSQGTVKQVEHSAEPHQGYSGKHSRDVDESPRPKKRLRGSDFQQDTDDSCITTGRNAHVPSAHQEVPEETTEGADFHEPKQKHTHYQIKNLSIDGFNVLPKLETGLDNWHILYEKTRVLQTLPLLEPSRVVLSKLHDAESINKLISAKFASSRVEVHNTQAQGTEELTFSARVEISKTDKGPLFQTYLQPPLIGRALRAQRDLGWDRFLFLDVPDLAYTKELPSHLHGEQSFQLKAHYLKLLLQTHRILDRNWRVVYIKENSTKGYKKKDLLFTHRLTLFALDGVGLKPMSLVDFTNWIMPIGPNIHQPFCKAIARFELSLSATDRTIIFQPEQIKRVRDVLADAVVEKDLYEDRSLVLNGLERRRLDDNVVMTDGCALISVGAAVGVCGRLGITGERPSAFQARINGAKGIWFISDSYDSRERQHLDIWIEIRDSQLKIEPREEDLDSEKCQPNRWSFDIVSWSRSLKPSTLHRDFIPILEDRGVPRDTIKTLVSEGLQHDTGIILKAAKDPIWLSYLRHQYFGQSSDISSTEAYGLPQSSGGLVRLLLEKFGFDQTQYKFLATAYRDMATFLLANMRQQLRVNCFNSTMAIGIADPKGFLQPGEVHICFSRPFLNPVTGASVSTLDGVDLLVARDPTLRGSDVQRVRTRYVSALSHLKDVVVFPSKGSIPLAAKLQGGDYDGDTFWLCWDTRLTESFRNAPLLQPIPLEDFGIKQQSETLKQLVSMSDIGTESHVDIWFKMAFRFKLQPNLLGSITNYYYRLAHHRRDLWQPDVRAIADLHDWLIDASKNGYVYTHDDLKGWLAKMSLAPLAVGNRLPNPAFFDSIKWQTKLQLGQENLPQLRDIVNKPNPHRGNILDEILFGVIDPLINNTISEMCKRTDNATLIDADIEHFAREYEAKHKAGSCHDEKMLADLDAALVDVRNLYKLIWAPPKSNKERRHSAWEKCHEAYMAIEPPCTAAIGWNFRTATHAPTLWEQLKASRLACRHPPPRLLFGVAREAVGFLKTHSQSGREIVTAIAQNKKTREPKGDLLREGSTGAEDEYNDFDWSQFCLDNDDDS